MQQRMHHQPSTQQEAAGLGVLLRMCSSSQTQPCRAITPAIAAGATARMHTKLPA